MNFTNFDLDQILGFDDTTNPLMMLIWIIPIIIFVFYGQRIQLQITSNEIKKSISKLNEYKNDSRNELITYVKNNLNPSSDPTKKIDTFIEYFTIMPVDIDPNGIVPKIKHFVRSREDITREHVRSIDNNISELELSRIQTLLEVASSLNMLYKIINHLYLTAKKQNNYPLILPLQMMLPFLMEEAEALKGSISAFKQGQPIGDGIGPMVVGKLMLNTTKQNVAFQTVLGETEFEGRKLLLLKAEGPASTVGRPADALEKIFSKNKIDAIIMIDASLKLEGEDSAKITQGFGAAIGGIGTERYEIEEIATKNQIPVFAIVIKQSVQEAITLMTKDIANTASEVRNQLFELIKQNTKSGQSVIVIGVGNTMGVSQ